MKINLTLSKSSIDAAIRELDKYQKKIKEKSAELVRKLAEAGIAVAKGRRGRWGELIQFYPSATTFSADGTTAEIDLIGTAEPIGDIKPLAFAEFGSGWLANVLWDVEGVGQGTFPNQTHAFDPKGWYYRDEDGELHHTFGELPTYPMYFASLEIMQKVDEIGREVFGRL